MGLNRFEPKSIYGKYLAFSEIWCTSKGKNMFQKYFYEYFYD